MRFEVDGTYQAVAPDSVNWTPPPMLGIDGNGAPFYAPYWACALGFSRWTEVLYETWFDLMDSLTHTITLPHPSNGVPTTYTVYVNIVTGRMDSRGGQCDVVMVGLDVTLSRITVVAV